MTESSKRIPLTPLSEAINVSKSFASRSGLRATSGRQKYVQAVDRTSLQIHHRESLGLMGESGCGKSTLARLLLRLETPTAGDILFEGINITRQKGLRLRQLRRQMQIVFQDPAASLNPRFTTEMTLSEAITTHDPSIKGAQLKGQIAALLDMVGLPLSVRYRLPHEFSGGERQRISIARAIAVEPKFLVVDEPVTSLDMANQEQILSLLESLKKELGVAFLMIAHELDTLQRMCSKVAVMYLGRIVECGDVSTLVRRPAHPYTRALIASRLSTVPGKRARVHLLPGEPPSPMEPPGGCHFHPRCPWAVMECRKLVPLSREKETGHTVRCHFNFDGNRQTRHKELDIAINNTRV